MSDSDTRKAKESRRSLWRRQGSHYREKLERKPVYDEADEVDISEVAEAPRRDANLEALRALVERTQNGGAVFQSVVVAALQILDRALFYEQRAAEAAISLGQREKLQVMIATTGEVLAVLKGTLSAQGAKVMDLCAEQRREEPSEDTSWWFALTDVIEILAEGAERMHSLTSAQPEGSPAHELSEFVAQLLHGHYHELQLEAEQWIS